MDEKEVVRELVFKHDQHASYISIKEVSSELDGTRVLCASFLSHNNVCALRVLLDAVTLAPVSSFFSTMGPPGCSEEALL